MGFFSGIGKALGGIVGAVTEPISSVLGIGKDIMGIGAPFMEQQSTAEANRINAEQAAIQRDWQQFENRHAQAWAGVENAASRDFQREQTYRSMDFSSAEAAKGRDFSSNEAALARDWSSNMANTAYQRAVRDMKAAGLNPMLAYMQGGSSTPPAASASAGATPSVSAGGAGTTGASTGGGSTAAPARPTFTAQSVASAAQAAQLGASVQQTRATTDNIKADTLNKTAEAERIAADTRLKRLTGDTESYRPQLITSQSRRTSADARRLEDTLYDTIDQIRADVSKSRASATQIRAQNVLMKELQDNPATRSWAPYLLDVFRPR